MQRVTWPQALGWRLGRHLLDPVGAGSVVDAVRRLGAVPSADAAAAELALRLRCGRSRSGDVDRALAAGRLIRTFAFRGAVHLMTPEEGADVLALRAAGRMWERRGWREFYRLKPADWPGLLEAVEAALADGPLTREELAAAVTRRPGLEHLRPAFVEPSYTFLKALAWQGSLSLGPPRDGQATFQGLAGTPRWPGLPDLDEAGPRAVSAYLGAYGPATPGHLHYWLGNGLGAGRGRIDRWLAGLGDRLAAVEVEGTRTLVRAPDLEPLLAATPSTAVRLLPGYDQWVLGAGTADPNVVPPAHRAAVTRGANLAVRGGVVTGTWSLRDDVVNVAWFDARRRADDEALAAQVERLAGLLARPLRPG